MATPNDMEPRTKANLPAPKPDLGKDPSGRGPIHFNDNSTSPNFFLSPDYPCRFTDSRLQGTASEHTFTSLTQYFRYHKALILADITDQELSDLCKSEDLDPKAEGEKREELPEKILRYKRLQTMREIMKDHKFTKRQGKRWEEEAYDVALRGNRCKFGQDVHLRNALGLVCWNELIYACDIDSVLGVGFRPQLSSLRGSRHRWGANRHGKALMEISHSAREEIFESLDEMADTPVTGEADDKVADGADEPAANDSWPLRPLGDENDTGLM